MRNVFVNYMTDHNNAQQISLFESVKPESIKPESVKPKREIIKNIERTPSKKLLLVPRRAMSEKQWPQNTVVLTIEQFLEQIRALSFAGNQKVRNDDARFWATADRLAKESQQLLGLCPNYHQFSSQLLEENIQVAQLSSRTDFKEYQFLRHLKIATKIQKLLENHQILDSQAALYQARPLLKKGVRPIFLRQFSSIECYYLINPKKIELECLLALASESLAINFTLPYDAQNTGLTNGLKWIYEHIENHYNNEFLSIDYKDLAGDGSFSWLIKNLYNPSKKIVEGEKTDGKLELKCYESQLHEAKDVAKTIAAWRKNHTNPRIAVCLRSLDGSEELIEEELSRFGIAHRKQQGTPLNQTSAGTCLLRFFELKRDHIPRNQLLSLYLEHALKAQKSVELIAGLAKILKIAVIRSDSEDSGLLDGAYERRLKRLLQNSDLSSHEESLLQWATPILLKTVSTIQKIPQKATLIDYISLAKEMAEEQLADRQGSGTSPVREALLSAAQLLKAFSADQEIKENKENKENKEIKISYFYRLLKQWLSHKKTRSKKEICADAVEIVSLPSLLGEKYDLLIFTNCVHGKLPLFKSPVELLSKQDRLQINRSFKKDIFHFHRDDVFEADPISSDQILEVFWFANTFNSAKNALMLTCSKHDLRGKEQLVSEFFEETLLSLGMPISAMHAGDTFERALHPQEIQAFWAKNSPNKLAHSQQNYLERSHKLRDERELYFSLEHEQRFTGDYTFNMGAELFADRQHFAAKLGLEANKPLTPTRIEALALCPFKAFIEQFLRVDTSLEGGQDADARVLGNLAHLILELFFKERYAEKIPTLRMNLSEKTRFQRIFKNQSSNIADGQSVGHIAALKANLSWLEQQIWTMLRNLSIKVPVEGVTPQRFEARFGVQKRGQEAAKNAAVPVKLPDRTIYLGGEIDRIDTGPTKLVVIDYKSGSKQSINSKLYSKELFRTHFQLPIYLRMVEHYRRQNPHPKLELFAYLISIKDGVASQILDKNVNLEQRTMDDTREDGLAQSVNRVLKPIFAGQLDAKDNPKTCRICRLARLCGKNTISKDLSHDDSNNSHEAN